MPFPSSQRSRPAAPQANKSGMTDNAVPFTPGPKKEIEVLSSQGSSPTDPQYEVGTGKPQE